MDSMEALLRTCKYNSAPPIRRRNMTLVQYVPVCISKNMKYDKGPLSLADSVLHAAIHTPLCRGCGSRAGESGEDEELVQNLTGALISESETDSCTMYGEPGQLVGGNMGTCMHCATTEAGL